MASFYAVLLIFSILFLTGCGSLTNFLRDATSPSGANSSQAATPGTTPLAALPPFEIPVSVASGVNVEENESAIIDYSNASEGYVMAKFLQETETNVRVIVETPNGTSYFYNLAINEFEVFPLTEGDGTYIIGIYERVVDNRYRVVLKAHVDVVISDPLLPFLRPHQFVNFDKNSEVVRVASGLVAGAGSFLDKISAVFNFIIENIDYDFELAATVQSGYVPDVDEVLRRGMGICFCYAAVMTAMLRSQGIPTKMVFGYTGDAYHAWINVYSEETGWINNIIFFDGVDWVLMDPTFAAVGGQAGIAQFIGEGANYVSKLYY
jgi:transglutaminase-like putative cysteine protease